MHLQYLLLGKVIIKTCFQQCSRYWIKITGPISGHYYYFLYFIICSRCKRIKWRINLRIVHMIVQDIKYDLKKQTGREKKSLEITEQVTQRLD